MDRRGRAGISILSRPCRVEAVARIRDPDHYSLPQYCADMNALMACLGIRKIDWVGTSLGSLVGMVMVGLRGGIVSRLVINDIGPYVTAGLLRIGQYIGNMPASFPIIEKGERYFRKVLEPHGFLSDEHWRHLTTHSLRWDEERKRFAVLCYPAIAKGFKKRWYYPPLDLWKYWEAIKVPILVLRNASSDLLSREMALEMPRLRGSAVTPSVPSELCRRCQADRPMRQLPRT
jgi:pimeloyl-ACP methyl ester carboxylesterase